MRIKFRSIHLGIKVIASRSFQKRFDVDFSGLKYMVKLIDRYGIEIVKKGKNCYYSPELKQEND